MCYVEFLAGNGHANIKSIANKTVYRVLNRRFITGHPDITRKRGRGNGRTNWRSF